MTAPDNSVLRRLDKLVARVTSLESAFDRMTRLVTRSTTPLNSRLWQFVLKHDMGYLGGNTTDADLYTIQNSDTSRDVTITDTLGLYPAAVAGDSGLCLEQIDIDGSVLYVPIGDSSTQVTLGKTRSVAGYYPPEPANVFGVRLLSASFPASVGQQAITFTTLSDLVYAYSPCCYVAEGSYVLVVLQANGQYFMWPCSCGGSLPPSQSSSQSASGSQSGSTSGSQSGSASGSQSGSSSGSQSGSQPAGSYACDASSSGYMAGEVDCTLTPLSDTILCHDCSTYQGTWTLPRNVGGVHGCGNLGECTWYESWGTLTVDPCSLGGGICVVVTYDSGTDTSTMTCTTSVCGVYSATTSGKWDLTNFSVNLNQDIGIGSCTGPSTLTIASV